MTFENQGKNTPPKHHCRRCDVTWNGSRTCHCCTFGGGCGRIFPSITDFDAHRITVRGQRICKGENDE